MIKWEKPTLIALHPYRSHGVCSVGTGDATGGCLTGKTAQLQCGGGDNATGGCGGGNKAPFPPCSIGTGPEVTFDCGGGGKAPSSGCGGGKAP